MARLKKDDFILRSINAHGERYDYSKVEYKNTKTDVIIICKNHGEFFQKPEKHMIGQGCSECMIEDLRNKTIARNMDGAINIDRKILKDLYIDNNLNQDLIAKKLDVSPTTVSKYIRLYNLDKDCSVILNNRKETCLERFGGPAPVFDKKVKDKIESTNLEKYGARSVFQNEEIQDKIEKTMVERYGATSPMLSKELRSKIEKTNLDKYGSTSPFGSESVRLAARETMLDKWGVEYPIQNDDIKKKIRDTNLSRYGFEILFDSPSIRNRIKNSQIDNKNILVIFGKTISEWSDEYGVPRKFIYYYNKSKDYLDKDSFINVLKNYKPYMTRPEVVISEALSLDKWDKKGVLSLPYKPDFKLSDSLYLNVDGLYWHSELNKDKWYHFNMRKDYEENNSRIIQFRSDEVFNKLNIIKSMVLNATGRIANKIGARKLLVKKVNSQDARIFLDENHIKGYKHAKNFGLYLNNQLISIMSYKFAKSNSIIKIERFCNLAGWSVAGSFSKLLKAIKKDAGHNPKIHYWVDLRYGTGNFLLNHGFHIQKETLGWDWTDGFSTYNRLSCRANMDQRKLSEREYADELGLYKIYDAGQRLYVSN